MSCKYNYKGVEYTLSEIKDRIIDILLENNISESSFNTNSDIRFSIIGERAASNVENYKKSLEEAKSMEENGASPIEIETKTKWYKYQGQWRTLSNEAMRDFKDINLPEINKKTNLKTILRNGNILLKMYPNLDKINVILVGQDNKNIPDNVKNALQVANGLYVSSDRNIYINSQAPLSVSNIGASVRSTLIHELQHVIQEEEAMPLGGNLNTTMISAYRIMGLNGDTKYVDAVSSIESRDKSKFSDNNNKILDKAIANIGAIISRDEFKLNRDYESLMGEIDANIASEALNSLYFVEGDFDMIYSRYLNDYLYLKNISEQDIISIYDSKIQSSIIENKSPKNTPSVLNLDSTKRQEIEFKIATNPKYIVDALIQGGYVQQDCSL